MAVDLEIDRDSGRIRLGRAVAADDSGQAVNPDGIKNQVEGAIVQAASWTLHEEVAFDRMRITSRDWASYPILRFEDVFKSVDVHVIDRPGQPFLAPEKAGRADGGRDRQCRRRRGRGADQRASTVTRPCFGGNASLIALGRPRPHLRQSAYCSGLVSERNTHSNAVAAAAIPARPRKPAVWPST